MIFFIRSLVLACAMALFFAAPGPVFAQNAPAPAAEPIQPALPAFVPRIPRLSIPIPGFKGFSEIRVTTEGGSRTLDIPFLAEYIKSIYAFVLGIVGTIATVMIVYAGIRWLTAGGSQPIISAAKASIANAVVGIIIALGSYLILYTINPEIVRFRSIQIAQIQSRDEEEPGEPEPPEETEAAPPVAPPPAGAPSAGDPCHAQSTGEVFDPGTLVDRVTVGNCLGVGLVHPDVAEPLRRAGESFCRLRPNPSMRIKGQGYRTAEKSLKFYLTRCVNRVNCTIGTGCPLRGGVLTREGGIVTTVDPALRNLPGVKAPGEGVDRAAAVPGGALYEALKRYLVTDARGGHSEGRAVDIFCTDESTGTLNVPCHLALERAMREAGFCRIPNEAWHFELPGSPRGDRRCSTGWNIGKITLTPRQPDGSKGTPIEYDYSSCAGIWKAPNVSRYPPSQPRCLAQ